MHIGQFLISHAKTAKLIQPCEGTLDDPASSAEAATMFRITHRKLGQDVSDVQSAADVLRVIGAVA